MKKFNNFDPEDPNKEKPINPIVAIVEFVLAIIIIGTLFYLGWHYVVSAGQAPLLALGMLGDPFRTTRRMKVPYKFRVGHRERAFVVFIKISIALVAGSVALLFIAQIANLFGG